MESINLLSTAHVLAAVHKEHVAGQKPVRTAEIQPVLPLNYGITGVRQDAGGNVAITGGTGSPSLKDGTPAFIYYGPLNQMPSSPSAPSLHLFLPSFPGQTVTAAQFYGPNTPLFDPSIGTGNIRAVGAYGYTGSQFQNGVMYTGPLDGSGTYVPIHAPGDGVRLVADTIPHSTMGNLVVGNFDYQGDLARGHGFIYDIVNKTYKTVDFGQFSTTLYGIWQNGGPSGTHYTIVGGFSGAPEGGKAFIVGYNTVTQTFRHFRAFTFNNVPSIITHFEGISAFRGGFSIAATSGNGASYAFIPVNKDGSFGRARWVGITNQINGALTSGDTVIDTSVMGGYPASGGGFQSFISNVGHV